MGLAVVQDAVHEMVHLVAERVVGNVAAVGEDGGDEQETHEREQEVREFATESQSAQRNKGEERMPTIEGKAGKWWIDAYVKKAGKVAGVAKAVRTLVNGKTSVG